MINTQLDRRDFIKRAGAASIAIALPRAAAAAKRSERRPNIVFILADDMGYSDLRCMGGEADTANIDRLAKEGVLFANFYNNAKCAPTRASIMTGLYPQRVNAHRGAGNVEENNGVTLAEVLREHGYATLMAGKWHIKPDPTDLGFIRHFGSLLKAVYFKPVYDDTITVQYDGQKYEIPDDENWYSTIAYTDYAIKFIKEEALRKNKPFFLYYAPHNPHFPLHALPEDIAKYKDRYNQGTDALRKARYRRMIELGIVEPKTWKLPKLEEGVPKWDELSPEEQRRMSMKLAIHTAMVDRLDQEVGRLLKFLEQSGQMDNTLIMFLSDNGASPEGGMLGEGWRQSKTNRPPGGKMGTVHSYVSLGTLGAAAVNAPLRKYKTTLYEGGCCTPFIVRWPAGVDNPGRMTRQVGYVTDIMPTCLEVAGAEYPRTYKSRKPQAPDGKSLVTVFKGKELGARTICWNYKTQRVVRKGKWKMWGQIAFGGRKEKPWELYDLSADRSETNNVAEKHPEVVRELESIWEQWNKDTMATKGYEQYFQRSRSKPL